MTELVPQAANILSQAPELLKHPAAVPIITGFIQWLSSRVFTGKTKTQETLATITRGEANAETITKIKAFLELVIEDNEVLRKELKAKLQEVESGLKQAGIQITKTNTANVTGNNNKVYQDVSGSTITDNSVTQTHKGTGDNIGRDKIVKREND